jgi:hypothetical protein
MKGVLMQPEILMTPEQDGKFAVKVPYNPRFSEVLKMLIPEENLDRGKGFGYQPLYKCWVFPSEYQYMVEDILDQMFFGARFSIVDSIPSVLDEIS